jgi:hypothetical protein
VKKALALAAAVAVALVATACTPDMESGVVIAKDHQSGHWMHCGKGCMIWNDEEWNLRIQGVNEEGEEATGWVDVPMEVWDATEVGDEYPPRG